MKRKIMIIDDDLELLSILHDVFKNEGFEVIVYSDRNSIKGVIIGQPDVVLLDNKLPDGFGHELCSLMKENSMTKKVPVILTSGYHDLAELARQCGADAYLEKPFDLDVLITLVNQQLASADAATLKNNQQLENNPNHEPMKAVINNEDESDEASEDL